MKHVIIELTAACPGLYAPAEIITFIYVEAGKLGPGSGGAPGLAAVRYYQTNLDCNYRGIPRTQQWHITGE